MISFRYNKKRIGFGLVFFILFNIIGIWFIVEPEIFIRNFLMKEEHIKLIGILLFFYSLFMLCSFILLLNKKEAFIISDNYLIDNSRYESIGKIYFNEIHDVKRVKKYSLKIVLKESIFKIKKLNILQKILLMVNNWNSKNSIIVSSALMNCEIDVLEASISSYMDKYKHR
ncbi:STM3941 family protein [uncultured Psychroserpens sp.]|uniref:STM3941 family protein n=1 Tax=uncultured Psychroserpens sp. TaxID=255436 RepID=UPI00262F651D|nr:STM3941 family protein [uncultured Psychroserpens sp.]